MMCFLNYNKTIKIQNLWFLNTVIQKAIEAPIADKILNIRVVSEGSVAAKTNEKMKIIGIIPK